MDTGSKTLAQLSEENKETKYVSLDTASHISGYTKDYLERLCRINKVTYKLGPNAAFVIELESLLHETQAILLSYEGITFVDKSELSDPVAGVGTENTMLSSASREVDTRVATLLSEKDIEGVEHRVLAERATRELPHFGESEENTGNPFSFVGRAVVSDVEPQSMKHPKAASKVAVAEITPERSEKPKKEEKEVLPVQEVKSAPPVVIKEPEPIAPRVVSTPPTAMHIKVMTDKEEEIQAAAVSGSPIVLAPYEKKSDSSSALEHVAPKVVVPHAPTKVKVVADNWDAALLGHNTSDLKTRATHVQVLEEREEDIPSPYRPVQTSVDREVHDDPAPLFPVIDKKQHVAESVLMKVEEPAPVKEESKVATHAFAGPALVAAAPHVPTPAAPEKTKQKVTVFEPSDTAPASTPKMVPSSVVMSNRIAAVDSIIGVDAIPMKGIPATVVEKEDRVPSKPSLAAIPMNEEEHHLSVYEPHPLMKSTGFNAVFAVMLLGASFFVLGGTYLENVGSSVNSATYLAGVGAATDSNLLGETATSTDTDQIGTPESGGVLPFSNEIIATSGVKANTVIIQPIFESGAGKTYEFMVVPVAK